MSDLDGFIGKRVEVHTAAARYTGLLTRFEVESNVLTLTEVDVWHRDEDDEWVKKMSTRKIKLKAGSITQANVLEESVMDDPAVLSVSEDEKRDEVQSPSRGMQSPSRGGQSPSRGAQSPSRGGQSPPRAPQSAWGGSAWGAPDRSTERVPERKVERKAEKEANGNTASTGTATAGWGNAWGTGAQAARKERGRRDDVAWGGFKRDSEGRNRDSRDREVSSGRHRDRDGRDRRDNRDRRDHRDNRDNRDNYRRRNDKSRGRSGVTGQPTTRPDPALQQALSETYRPYEATQTVEDARRADADTAHPDYEPKDFFDTLPQETYDRRPDQSTQRRRDQETFSRAHA